jgi:protein-tyrosine phosphatase
MQGPYERHIRFASVFNFRDLGGYHTRDGRTVRWRRLFRSSEIQRMTEAEAAYVRDHLGVARDL